jgi:hypothetical protein
LRECRLLVKLRWETKTWTQEKEWNDDFWSPAAFRCQVPLFPCRSPAAFRCQVPLFLVEALLYLGVRCHFFLVGPCPHSDRDYRILEVLPY